MTADNPPETPAVLAPELSPLLQKVVGRLGDLVLERHTALGDDRIHVARERILDAARLLRDDPELAFDLLLDVTAIDYLGQPDDFATNLEV